MSELIFMYAIGVMAFVGTVFLWFCLGMFLYFLMRSHEVPKK